MAALERARPLTPHTAALQGDLMAILMMNKDGQDVFALDLHGKTPLQIAREQLDEHKNNGTRSREHAAVIVYLEEVYRLRQQD